MIKVASLNISGGFYIGSEDTEYLDREAASSVDNRLLNQIIETIKNENLDVICFQEIITTREIKYLETISNNTNLKYYDYFELSDCNTVENSRCGLAIISKYPLNSVVKELFPNPMLGKTTSSGNTYYTYDKGYMIDEIELDNKRISILTHHGFPYRRFNSTPEENTKVFNFFDDKINEYNPDIITGDFNAEDFMNLMPKTSGNYKRTVNDITTVDSLKFDDILVHNSINTSTKKIKLLSDHLMIIDDIEI